MKNKKPDTKPEKDSIIDMPEVKDTPGQENIRPPRMGEMADTTASSAGEEGEGILDDLNSDEERDELLSEDSNVTDDERRMLNKANRPESDETKDLRRAAVDGTDGEDPLNEESDPMDMGEDLDVPGSELDDEDEETGEEDEENNSYSARD